MSEAITESKNDRVIEAMSTLFSSGATIGAFFAGFTLNIVVAVNANERPDVRRYVSICSLVFVVLVLLCSAGGVVFAYYREEFSKIMAKIHGNLRQAHPARGGQTNAEEAAIKRSNGPNLPEIVGGELDSQNKWRRRHLWTVFGLLPTRLFSILSAGVYFFFLIVRAYEPDVAFAGLAVIGMGTLCGGIGWMGLLASYTPLGRKLLQRGASREGHASSNSDVEEQGESSN